MNVHNDFIGVVCIALFPALFFMMRQMTRRTECVSLSHPLHVTTNEAFV